MAKPSSYLWIQTRDGSPTLWSNEISEPFRSTKGAFTESWTAFVRPALAHSKNRSDGKLIVGEFGLGPGTNWVLWSVAAKILEIPHEYHVVEEDLRFFEEGQQKWVELAQEVVSFVARSLSQDFEWSGSVGAMDINKLAAPIVYKNLDEMLTRLGPAQVKVWFHDPFGYAVNPEGYSSSTIQQCARLWASDVAGFSYAANRNFRNAIESLGQGIEFRGVDTGGAGLKRQRSEFYGAGL